MILVHTHPPRLAAARLPGPRAWPIIGDPLALGSAKNLMQYLDAHWRRYGDVFRVNVVGGRCW